MKPSIYINPEGIVCYMPECPEEPEYKNLGHYAYAERRANINFQQAKEKYEEQLAAAKASAVRFEDEDWLLVTMLLWENDDENRLLSQWLSENSDTIHPFPSEKYSVEIKDVPIPCPDGREGCVVYHTRKVAVLSPVQKNESQEKLWRELIAIIDSNRLANPTEVQNLIFQQFTILRKVKE